MNCASKRSVSISRDTGDRLYAHARKHGVPVSQLVESLLAPVLDGTVPIPEPARPPLTASPERSELDKQAYIRGVLTAIASAAPDAGLSAKIRFPVSQELYEDIAAQIQRGALVAGRPATPDALLDAGINRMLDQLESIPASRTCAVCAGEIQGSARQLPLGRNDALVTVCYACDTEHPRKGRYAFNGGRRTDSMSASVLTPGRDGNGNKQTRLR